MDIGTQLDRILACDTKDGLFELLKTIAAGYGFSTVSYVATRPKMVLDGGLIEFLSSAPERFLGTYMDEKFLALDPVIYRAAATSTPFFWSECREFDAFWKPRSGPKTDAVRVMEAAWEFGYPEGFVVPTHTIIAGQVIGGFVTFFWPDKNQPPMLTPAGMLTLRIAATTIHERYVRLCGVNDGVQEPTDLTDWERDCLCWAARGKSSAETAEILNLSTRTVEHHIASATRKLNAANKMQAVVIALQRGKILP